MALVKYSIILYSSPGLICADLFPGIVLFLFLFLLIETTVTENHEHVFACNKNCSVNVTDIIRLFPQSATNLHFQYQTFIFREQPL